MPLVITKRQAWLAAFRLHTLPLATCSILLGSAVAYTEHKFSFLILLLALSTAICLQILSNISNDYGDAKHGADTDERVGPKRMVQQKIISMEEIKIGIVIFIILSLVSGILLLILSVHNVGIYMAFILLLLGLGAIGAAIAYTATDNPYGYTGWGDLSVLIFFGIIGVFGSYFLQTGSFKADVLLPAAGMGLLSTGVLNINNIRDIETDRKAGKRTIAVRLGLFSAKVYHWCILLSAILLFFLYGFLSYHAAYQYIFLLPSILFIINAIGVGKSKDATEAMPFLKQLVISSLVFTVSYIISLVI